MQIFRQGDVLCVRIAKRPAKLEPIAPSERGVVLAEGEATGHAHRIKSERAALFRDPKLMAMFLHVSGDAPVALEHDEHTTIELPPGDYEVIRQVEYHPEAIRQVAD